MTSGASVFVMRAINLASSSTELIILTLLMIICSRAKSCVGGDTPNGEEPWLTSDAAPNMFFFHQAPSTCSADDVHDTRKCSTTWKKRHLSLGTDAATRLLRILSKCPDEVTLPVGL